MMCRSYVLISIDRHLRFDPNYCGGGKGEKEKGNQCVHK